MTKRHLGEMTEIAQRVENLENDNVLKAVDGISEGSDIVITEED